MKRRSRSLCVGRWLRLLLLYPLLSVTLVLLVLRELAPHLIERHPQSLAALLNGLFDRPLAIEQARLNWMHWTPELVMRGLRVDDPRGELRIERFALRPAEDFIGPDGPRLQGEFAGLSLEPTSDGPVVSGLGGEFRLDRRAGSLHLIDSELAVTLARAEAPLRPGRLSGVLYGQRHNGGWRFEPVLSLIGEAGHVALDGRVNWRAGADAELDLQAGVRVHDVARIPDFLPRSNLNPKLVDWLEQALVEGRVPRGRVVLRGAVGDFPFADDPNAGEFSVELAVADMRLRFAPDWPPIEQLQATVRFRGHSFEVESHSGRMRDAELHEVEARIADLGRSVLTIDGRAQGGLAALREVVEQSPLRERLSPYLAPLRLTGDGALDLALELPLKDRSAPRPVRGELRLQQAGLTLRGEPVTLEAVDGVLGFDQDGLRSGELSARLRGRSLALTLSGTESLALQAEGRGNWSPGELFGASAVLDNYAAGRSDWRIALAVPRLTGTAEYRYRLVLRSELRGTALRLPGRLAKPADSARPLELDITRSLRASTGMALRYGEQFDAEFELNGAGRPVDMRVRIAGLTAGGYRLVPTSLHGQWVPERYTVAFTGPGLLGQLVWPLQPAEQQTVWLALDRLVLQRHPEPASPPIAAIASIDPRRLPPLTLSIASLVLDGRELGQLTLHGAPDATGYVLHDLQLDGDRHRLWARGSWRDTPAGQESRLQLALSGRELHRSLNDAGLDLPVELVRGQLSLDLSWPDAPIRLDPARLSGELELALGEGAIVGLEPGIGRLLGLINIDSLARRLQLDFSDLAATGFAFDRIAGRARLGEGEAVIERLTVVGPAAELNLSGRVGLVSRDLDLQAELIPELGSSLALAGALAGGPVIGAAVLLAHQMLEPGLDRLMQLRYTIEGPWDNPRMERLDAASVPGGPGISGGNRK